jgi:hypothetical protein
VEPVAGVTPIRSMLDDLERPLPSMLRGSPLGVLPGRTERARVSDATGAARGEQSVRLGARSGSGGALDYDLGAHAAALAARAPLPPAGLVPVSTPLMVGGATQSAIAALGDLLEPLGVTPLAAGGTGSAQPAGQDVQDGGFVDGGSIGVSLIEGDMSAIGLGTVTRVEGPRLVAFGHPMMQVGVTALPTSQSRVLWFMASQNRSFKMGESTRRRGVLVNDRQASIVVHQDKQAYTVPVRVHIDGEIGAPDRDWSFELAHDAFVTPMFLAVAVGSALEAAAAERRDVTYSILSRVKFAGYPELTIEDFGSAPTGTPTTNELGRSSLLRAVGSVFDNEWEHVRLESVDVSVALRMEREVASLRGVELLTPEVEPGGAARLRVTLEPFGGKRETRVLSVNIPERFAGQRVELELRPGYEVEIVRASSESLAELLANLEDPTLAPRSLVVSYKTGDGAAAYAGHVALDLPAGVLDSLGTERSSVGPAQFASERHRVFELPYYVVGKDRVTVEVRERLR